MKFSVGTDYRFPTVVRHQGMVIVLALDEKRDISYRVLALDPAQPDDDKSWSDRKKLGFPDQIRPAGMSVVTVGLKTAERTADAPFQAVSDGKHVYLFRQSTDGTLYVDRFVFDPAAQTLNPTWEARFQRSRKRDLPASRKDTLGARDMESEPFFEPTTELTAVKGLQDGRFCALLLPGRLPSQWRWQIFVTNSDGEVHSFSIRRGEDGLFDMADVQRTCLKWADVGRRFQTGPAALLYMQQEEARDEYGRPQRVKRGARVMLAAPVGSSRYALELDGMDDYVSLGNPASLQIEGAISIEAWVKAQAIDGRREIVAHGADGVYLRIQDGTYQIGVGDQGASYDVPQEDVDDWIHLAGAYDGEQGAWLLFRNGVQVAPAPAAGAGDAAGAVTVEEEWAIGRSFAGQINNARLWSVARTAGEIRQDMHRRLAGDEPGLVGDWPVDEGSGDTVYDRASGNHGRLCLGYALELDGLADYVELPHMDPDYANGFTVEAWVRYRSLQRWSRIIDFGNGAEKDNIFFANWGTTNDLVFQVYRDGTALAVTAPGALETGTWMHLAATVDKDGNAAIYKNGQLLATGTIHVPATLNRTKNYVGRSNWVADGYLDGGMQQVRVWNIARSPDDIQATMNEPLRGDEPGLVGYWPLDGAAGDVIHDRAPGHHDGQLRLGYALALDGLDDYVELPYMDPDYADGFTVEAWVRYRSFPRWSRIIDFGNGADADNIVFANLDTTNDLVFQVYREGVWSIITAPGVLETGTWMHLAATVDRYGKAALYKNGQPLVSGTVDVPKTVGRRQNYIGRSNWAQDGYFDGDMGEVRVWKVARTQEEIQQDMQGPPAADALGLMGHWLFDEGTGDIVHDRASGHHGRLDVGYAKDSHALVLDGVDDYVDVADDAGLDVDQAITVEAWVKHHGGNGHVVNRGGSWDESGYSLLIWDGQIRVELQDAMRLERTLVDNPLPGDGAWHHVAFTWDIASTTVRTYLDGKLQPNTGTFGGPIGVPGQPLNIGRNAVRKHPFCGAIGDVRLWNVARSEADILANMHRRLEGGETGLVGYWPLDEGAGETIHDQTSEKHDGQIYVGPEDNVDEKWGVGPVPADSPDDKWGEGPDNADDKWREGPEDPNDKWVVVPPIGILDFGVSRDGTLALVGELKDGSEVSLALSGASDAATLPIPVVEADASEAAVPMPTIAVDKKGLTVSAGLLNFAHSGDTPFLLDGADGLIHLYFRGDYGKFLVAQHDTLTARVEYTLPLDDTDAGPRLRFTACRPGTEMEGYKIAIAEGSDGDACQVTIDNQKGSREAWQDVPRDLDSFLAVLNGAATSDAKDPLVREGDLVFYDYGSNVQREGVPDLTSADNPFFGSTLFAVGADNLPDTGVPIAVGNVEAAEMAARGLACAWIPEPQGKALRFGRADDYVALPHNKLAAAGDLAMEAWVQVADGDSSSATQRLINYCSEGARFALGLVKEGDGYKVFAASEDKAVQTADAHVPAEEWTHVAAVYNATNALKLDGQSYVDCGNDVTLDLTKAMTVEAWVTPTRESGQRRQREVILSKWGSTEEEQSWRLYIDTDGKPCFETRDRNKEVIAVKADLQLKAGKSYHLAGSFDASPVAGYALELNGKGQVILGKLKGLDAVGEISMAAWVRVRDTDGVRNIVVDGGEGPCLRICEGAYQTGVPSTHLASYQIPQEDVDTWVHLAGVYDGEQRAWILYRNGVEVSRHLGDAKALGADTDWKIGTSFIGLLNNVRIWDKALPKEQIGEDMDKPAPDVEGAVGNWAFDQVDSLLEKVQDKSNNENHGTRQGGTFVDDDKADADKASYTQKVRVYPAVEAMRVALDLDGADDHIELPEMKPDYAAGFTVEAWVRYTRFRDWSRIIDFGNGAPEDNILFANEGATSNLVLQVYKGGAVSTINAQGVLETGAWVHLAATVDGAGNAALYKNGQRLVTGTVHVPATLRRTKNYIGRSNWVRDGYFDGSMRQVRVWNIARSEAEIQANMHRRLAGDEPGLVGYWCLDEAEMLVGRARDHSGNGNDGQLHGGRLAWVDQDRSSWRWLHKEAVNLPIQADLGADEPEIAFSREPNIKEKDTLLIGDEQVRVQSVKAEMVTSQFKCVVERGVNGTTANEHPSGTRIYRLTSGDDTILETRTKVNIGRSASDTEYFQGIIDDARVWKASRRDWQIQYYRDQPLPGDAEGLVGDWRFEEGRGQMATDSKGSNHGRLVHPESDKIAQMWTPAARNARLTLYVDGRPVQTFDVEPGPAEYGGYGTGDQFTIGAMMATDETAVQQMAGSIDEVRVWNKVRSSEQIRDNMYRALGGAEEGLAGYWPLDEGTGTTVRDQTGNGQDGTVKEQQWIDSTAPIGNEGPEVRNVYGGLEKPEFNRQIAGPPAAVEYGDMQWDDEGTLFGVMKRCTIFRDDALQLVTGFKVGDLELNFIGQVQTAPTLIGYIEGAPPVPSENLTVKDPATEDYAGTSAIQLTEAKETVQVYSASRDTGFDMSVDFKAGVHWDTEISVGLGVQKKALKTEGKAGVHTYFEHSLGWLSEASKTAGTSKTVTKSLTLGGGWEEACLNPEVGRRYLPNNMGYALVKSGTADLFALRLKRTGSLVAFQILPNPDIPEDWNIIMFPLNPKYVKNGTLDGMVGLVADPDHPGAIVGERGSYFKPLEAYALKEQIEREAKQIEGYYGIFAAAAKAGTGADGLLSELPGGELGYDWETGQDRRNMVNTYVWTADGGFYAEEEQFSSIRQESQGSSYHFLGQAGLFAEAQFAADVGFYIEADALFGGHINVEVKKSKEEKAAFGLHVDVQGEGFLSRWEGDADKQQGRYTAEPCPGKVDGYRFMTFYLAPKPQNFDRFFEQIVDPEWLNGQGKYAAEYGPNARALREARSKPNEVWRVLHRVTYVSRIPPRFEPTPVEAVPQEVRRPANIEANMGLILEIERIKRLLPASPEESHLVILGRAVDGLLFGDTSGSGQDQSKLQQIVPWWDDRDEGVKRGIRQDLMAYLKAFYGSDLGAPEMDGEQERVTEGLQALYTFAEGEGKTVHDVSGVGQPLDLSIEGKEGEVGWLAGGLALTGKGLVATPGRATKLIQAAKASNQLTIEAWVKPAKAQQRAARIVTLSAKPRERNFALEQDGNRYQVYLRTTQTDDYGSGTALKAGEVATEAASHLVYTRDVSGQARFYLDGAEVGHREVAGGFSKWDDGYRFGLGNEIIGEQPWEGELHLVAVYNRALSATEVARNFGAGAGRRR